MIAAHTKAAHTQGVSTCKSISTGKWRRSRPWKMSWLRWHLHSLRALSQLLWSASHHLTLNLIAACFSLPTADIGGWMDWAVSRGATGTAAVGRWTMIWAIPWHRRNYVRTIHVRDLAHMVIKIALNQASYSSEIVLFLRTSTNWLSIIERKLPYISWIQIGVFLWCSILRLNRNFVGGGADGEKLTEHFNVPHIYLQSILSKIKTLEQGKGR